MKSIQEKGLSILIAVLLVISVFAFYALKWVGLLVPVSALTVYFMISIYIGLERALMHATYYFGIAMLFAIIIFGLLLVFPAWTFKIGVVMIILLLLSVAITIWRGYNGMLGRIQLHKWLS